MGLQPIWSSFGRRVVGNLITATSSLRNFTTLLLGLHFAEVAISSKKAPEEDRANLFLRFEQLAACSRYAYGERNGGAGSGILGITRVKKYFDERHGKVQISPSGEAQILSNQKSYGIWGLCTVAASQSGLVERETNTLTPLAQDFVDAEYLPRLAKNLGKDGKEVLRFLTSESSFEPKGKHSRLGKALAKLLVPKLRSTERGFYERVLVRGQANGFDHTYGRQAELWEGLCEINSRDGFSWESEFDFDELTAVMKSATVKKQETLAAALEHIRIMEPFFAATSQLFGFLLLRDDAKVDEVEQEIRKAWGAKLKHIQANRVEELGPRIEKASSSEIARSVVQLAGYLREGDYGSAVKLAIDHNATVMKSRGAAPWVSIEHNRLKVRLREEVAALSPPEDLPALWTNFYFINTLKIIGRSVIGVVT